jgi:hypothetical protein
MTKQLVFDFGRVVFSWQPERLLRQLLPNVQAARAMGWNALSFSTAGQAEADLRAAGWL